MLRATRWRSHGPRPERRLSDVELIASAWAELGATPKPVKRSRPVPTERQLICERCETPFPYVRGRQHCSILCARRSRFDRNMRKCKTCRNVFEAYTRLHVYCTRRCGSGRPPIDLRLCKICGRSFELSLGFELYCGPRCRTVAKMRQNKERIDRARPMKKCAVCECLFPTFHKRVVCGEECRKAWKLQRARENYARRQRQAKRPVSVAHG